MTELKDYTPFREITNSSRMGIVEISDSRIKQAATLLIPLTIFFHICGQWYWLAVPENARVP